MSIATLDYNTGTLVIEASETIKIDGTSSDAFTLRNIGSGNENISLTGSMLLVMMRVLMFH